MIWLIGSNGQLGSEVAKLLDHKKYIWTGTNSEVDISDWDQICNFEKKIETESYYPSAIDHYEREIKWIINCAAYNDVEGAEDNLELATAVNFVGPTNISRLCRKIGAKLIHISSDYVFNGITNRPYTEKIIKSPINNYGMTKAEGENSIEKEMVQYYIIRTSWLYGKNGSNFVTKMLDRFNTEPFVNVVNDQIGSPTSAEDLALAIIKLIEKSDNAKEIIGPKSAPAFGVYNFSDAGEVSRFEFAKEIYKLGKKHGLIKNNCEIEGISSKEIKQKALRPKYSVLDCSKISKELKLKIPNWKSSLDKYLKSLR